MKKLPAFAALAIPLAASLSCEQQSWEQTKMFNQNRHADHGGDTKHGAEAAPAHGAGHGETPAAAAESTPAPGH